MLIAHHCVPIRSELAPSFSIHSTSNERVSLADYAGRALVLMLMTSRCPACRVLSHSELRALFDAADTDLLLRGRVGILSVSVQDTMGTVGIIESRVLTLYSHAESLQAYQAEENYPWTVALDRDSLIVKYQSFSVPTVVVIGPNGEIHSRTQGAVATEGTLRKRVLDALGLEETTTHTPAPTLAIAAEVTAPPIRERAPLVDNAARMRAAIVDIEEVAPAGNNVEVISEEARVEKIRQRQQQQRQQQPQQHHVAPNVVWFAFLAGLFSFASPCSFAMLPGYAGYFIDHHTGIVEGCIMSLAAAAGLLCVYVSVAAVLLLGSAWASETTMPWLSVIGGLLTVGMGVALVLDKQFRFASVITGKVAQLYESLARMVTKNKWKRPHGVDLLADALPLHDKSHHRRDASVRSTLTALWWFGITYGSSSASCSSPIFISLLGMTLRDSPLDAAFVFGAYTLSVSLCIVAFTAAVCLFRRVLLRVVGGARTDNIRRLAGVLLVLLGVGQLVG